MKRLFETLPALTLATGMLVSGAAPVSATNLLVNPGFETGNFSGWTQSGNTTYTAVGTTNVHSGTYSASFGPIGTDGFISQFVADTAGTTYAVGGYVLNPGGTPYEFDIEVNGVTVLDLVNFGAQSYTLESAQFVGTRSDQITFSFRQDPSYIYFDDAFVSARPEPASMAVLGVGLAGIGFIHRRKRFRPRFLRFVAETEPRSSVL